MEPEQLQVRVHGSAALPTLIYLPGLHGDWTLVSSFRAAVAGKVRFVEFTYPRSLTWSLADYAKAIEDALRANVVHRGWLIGESFGSQVAWALLDSARDFEASGLVLVGGFVKHPWPWGARLMRRVGHRTPQWAMHGFLQLYQAYAHFRHREAPETLASIAEFVARRTPHDREAMRSRLQIVTTNDPRPIARRAVLPVYYLAGLVDPLVPWPYVRWWLRRHCPGYRGGRTCWRGDHNALASAPRLAAKTILNWIADTGSAAAAPGEKAQGVYPASAQPGAMSASRASAGTP